MPRSRGTSEVWRVSPGQLDRRGRSRRRFSRVPRSFRRRGRVRRMLRTRRTRARTARVRHDEELAASQRRACRRRRTRSPPHLAPAPLRNSGGNFAISKVSNSPNAALENCRKKEGKIKHRGGRKAPPHSVCAPTSAVHRDRAHERAHVRCRHADDARVLQRLEHVRDGTLDPPAASLLFPAPDKHI